MRLLEDGDLLSKTGSRDNVVSSCRGGIADSSAEQAAGYWHSRSGLLVSERGDWDALDVHFAAYSLLTGEISLFSLHRSEYICRGEAWGLDSLEQCGAPAIYLEWINADTENWSSHS